MNWQEHIDRREAEDPLFIIAGMMYSNILNLQKPRGEETLEDTLINVLEYITSELHGVKETVNELL